MRKAKRNRRLDRTEPFGRSQQRPNGNLPHILVRTFLKNPARRRSWRHASCSRPNGVSLVQLFHKAIANTSCLRSCMRLRPRMISRTPPPPSRAREHGYKTNRVGPLLRCATTQEYGENTHTQSLPKNKMPRCSSAKAGRLFLQEAQPEAAQFIIHRSWHMARPRWNGHTGVRARRGGEGKH